MDSTFALLDPSVPLFYEGELCVQHLCLSATAYLSILNSRFAASVLGTFLK